MDLYGINSRDWQDSVPSRNDEKESIDSSLKGWPNSLSRGSVSRPAMHDLSISLTQLTSQELLWISRVHQEDAGQSLHVMGS